MCLLALAISFWAIQVSNEGGDITVLTWIFAVLALLCFVGGIVVIVFWFGLLRYWGKSKLTDLTPTTLGEIHSSLKRIEAHLGVQPQQSQEQSSMKI
jgi:hypothetical protein